MEIYMSAKLYMYDLVYTKGESLTQKLFSTVLFLLSYGNSELFCTIRCMHANVCLSGLAFVKTNFNLLLMKVFKILMLPRTIIVLSLVCVVFL